MYPDYDRLNQHSLASPHANIKTSDLTSAQKHSMGFLHCTEAIIHDQHVSVAMLSPKLVTGGHTHIHDLIKRQHSNE